MKENKMKTAKSQSFNVNSRQGSVKKAQAALQPPQTPHYLHKSWMSTDYCPCSGAYVNRKGRGG